MLQNDEIRAIIDFDFTHYQFCLSDDTVDVKNDNFELRAVSSNDVSFNCFKRNKKINKNLGLHQLAVY